MRPDLAAWLTDDQLADVMRKFPTSKLAEIGRAWFSDSAPVAAPVDPTRPGRPLEASSFRGSVRAQLNGAPRTVKEVAKALGADGGKVGMTLSQLARHGHARRVATATYVAAGSETLSTEERTVGTKEPRLVQTSSLAARLKAAIQKGPRTVKTLSAEFGVDGKAIASALSTLTRTGAVKRVGRATYSVARVGAA